MQYGVINFIYKNNKSWNCSRVCETEKEFFEWVDMEKEYNYKKVFKCIYRVLIPVVGLSFILYINNVGINGINIISFVKQILSEP